jgi:hypothetical protein
MFYLQSQWIPETNPFLYVAREKLQRGTHVFRFLFVRYYFGQPAFAQFFVPEFFYHSLMNCGLRHIGIDVKQTLLWSRVDLREFLFQFPE